MILGTILNFETKGYKSKMAAAESLPGKNSREKTKAVTGSEGISSLRELC